MPPEPLMLPSMIPSVVMVQEPDPLTWISECCLTARSLARTLPEPLMLHSTRIVQMVKGGDRPGHGHIGAIAMNGMLRIAGDSYSKQQE